MTLPPLFQTYSSRPFSALRRRAHTTGGSLANNLTRSLLLLLAACALALPSLSAAQAEQAPQAKKTATKKTKTSKAASKPKQAAMVIDANTGRVLHDQD